MKKFYVYVHTCTVNGKKYVGCTTQAKPEFRWLEGRGYRNNEHFYRAILKHGWNNFQHEVFEVESEEEMYRKEVELISFYHSNDPRYGYNHSSGGEKSASGCIRSEETRKKLSEALKGKTHSEETRKKISEALKGKTHKPFSEEAKRHMSEAKKGKPHKPCSEEARKHMSEAAKKKAKDPEYRKKLSEAQKGKPHNFSEEARKRISETHKGKPKPRIKISLPDGTIIEITKNNLVRDYINKGKKFEYVS